MKILGIETSCDETSAAVIEDGHILLSNEIASSVDLHKAYGGVVPEIAARSHIELIIPVIEQALASANCTWDDIDAIAVTYGPGLIGSLLIGVLTARTLAITKRKPLIAVNHVSAHPYALLIDETPLPGYKLPQKQAEFPALALTVSGGHTQLVYMDNPRSFKMLGQSGDDAAGEAYDKVAKMLGLPYPGGPELAKLAELGNPATFKFPKAKLSSPYDFSFSGLKTAVLRTAQSISGNNFTFPSYKLSEVLKKAQKADIAASFQKVVNETLVNALKKAETELNPKTILISGGVAANEDLRAQASQLSTPVLYPDIRLCTDNAAMIATYAFYNQKPTDPYVLEPDPSLNK